MPSLTNRQTVAVQRVRQLWADLDGRMPKDYVARCVEIGDELLELQRDEASKGKAWKDLFPDHADERKSDQKMPWGIDDAKRYMAIARNDGMRDGAHAHRLPKDLTTLAILARLDAPQTKGGGQVPSYQAPRLIKALKAGKIDPAMTRRDVAIVKSIFGREPKTVHPSVVRQRKFEAAQRAIRNLGPSQRHELLKWLRGELREAA